MFIFLHEIEKRNSVDFMFYGRSMGVRARALRPAEGEELWRF